jgi:hypothetical protein
MEVSGQLHVPAVLPPGKNVIKSNATCRARHAAQMEETRNSYRILTGSKLTLREYYMIQ